MGRIARLLAGAALLTACGDGATLGQAPAAAIAG